MHKGVVLEAGTESLLNTKIPAKYHYSQPYPACITGIERAPVEIWAPSLLGNIPNSWEIVVHLLSAGC